jgi:DNA-binding MarR family transcriptional regulator
MVTERLDVRNDPPADRFPNLGRVCVNYNLRKASRAVNQVFDAMLRPTGLRASQFAVLVALAQTDTVTITRLARWLVMDRTTLSRNLRPLAAHGYLTVVPGADRREQEIRITSPGEEVLRNAYPYWEKAQANISGGLGPTRWKQLMEALAATVSHARGVE